MAWRAREQKGAPNACTICDEKIGASIGKPAMTPRGRGEYVSAIEHFERAMRLSPLDPLTYFASTGMAFAHAFAGRYDQAISWATKALHEQPNWATPLRVAAVANALSGRMVEARAAMACLREVDPALRLGNLDRVAPPLRRAEDRVR